MGMFSWVCKGCGEELISREIVRLDGCVGEYDGYGSAGSFDHCGDPVAWHQRCWLKASDAQKLDTAPSASARNQGFGMAHLEHLPGFDPKAKTEFSVKIEPLTGKGVDPEKEHYPVLYITCNGGEDQSAWERGYKEAEAKLIERLKETGSSQNVAWDNFEADWQSRNPHRRALVFPSIEQAQAAADLIVKEDGYEEYVVHVIGSQKGCGEGEVYRFMRQQDFRSYVERQNPDQNNIVNEEWRTKELD